MAVGRGSRVGVLFDQSTRTYVSLLAVLKAGAAYVPLDTSYPPDRVVFILALGGAGARHDEPPVAADVPGRRPRDRLTATPPGPPAHRVHDPGQGPRPDGV